jgi:predicted transcriptional regulator
MRVRDAAERLGLEIAAGKDGLDREIRNGFCGDLLSDVMGRAPEGCLWLTVQGHQNIVAVAVLKEMAGVVLVNGHAPDEDTVARADAEGIPLLRSPDSAFSLAGRLFADGVGGTE